MSKNELANATSPYLQQHADNPVNWQEWSESALAEARRLNKPILLSIGYSACHWCHVMAHESFENDDTAAVMNDLFINIKVDREERPDLDKVYQTANQLLNQRAGGWPLTVFLDPADQTPFFSGTYFPDKARHGLPAFGDLLVRLHQAFGDQKEAIGKQSRSLRDALARLAGEHTVGSDIPAAPVIKQALQQLRDNYDSINGGFGSAPKFPHPDNLALLIEQADFADDQSLLDMATHTLERMALGGIYDQAGGGFCRYSVDDQWMIPHFEKMLYDNGPLLAVYAQTWRITADPLFRQICESLVQWLFREMLSPEGAFWSSLDADSEGEEGLFYVWTREQIKALIPTKDHPPFVRHFGIEDPANFEGSWHLHAKRRSTALAQQYPDIESILQRGRQALLDARDQRIRPGTDDKILTAWNALMIKGLAIAGRLLANSHWVDAAATALTHIHTAHWQNGRLLASYKDGHAHLPAYLDDHAYLLDAILALLQARWDDQLLVFASQVADLLLSQFEDQQRGGFFFTANDHEQLIQRPKPFSDDATPSGNGIAADTLLRLGHLLGEMRYIDAAERTLVAAGPAIQKMPYAHASLLRALQHYHQPPAMVILRGTQPSLAEWQAVIEEQSAATVVFAIPDNARDLPTLLAEKIPAESTIAYLCTGTECQPPTTHRDVLLEMLC